MPFRSPGAAAATSLEEYLIRRRVQEIEDMLAGEAREDRARRIQHDEADRARRAKIDQQADADRLAVINGPSSNLDPQTAAALRAAGYRVDAPTLAARTMNVDAAPGVTIGSQDLPSVTRRRETFSEQTTRETLERERRGLTRRKQRVFVSVKKISSGRIRALRTRQVTVTSTPSVDTTRTS